MEQFGKRRANEILMLDKPVSAQEAVQCGFANGIITDLNGTDHWPDLSKIPTLAKLCATDARTLVNCKELINAARDNARIEQTIVREARALVETWMEESFFAKMASYVQSNVGEKKKKKPEPKL